MEPMPAAPPRLGFSNLDPSWIPLSGSKFLLLRSLPRSEPLRAMRQRIGYAVPPGTRRCKYIHFRCRRFAHPLQIAKNHLLCPSLQSQAGDPGKLSLIGSYQCKIIDDRSRTYHQVVRTNHTTAFLKMVPDSSIFLSREVIKWQ